MRRGDLGTATLLLCLSLRLAACARVEAARAAEETRARPLHFEALEWSAVPAELAVRADAEFRARFPQGDEGTLQVQRAALHDGLELDLVWIDAAAAWDPPSCSLIVRRTADGALSHAASRWWARWERDLEMVLAGLRIADLHGDGTWQLVYQQREHNGTMHNEATDHYFTIGSDLALHEVLALAPWTRDLYSLAEQGQLTRTVRAIGSGELLLEVRSENPHYGDPGTLLGRARLSAWGHDGVYAVEDAQVLVARYGDFIGLRTGSEDSCDW